ncbi:MAG: class I SAM-dependent methyltransferase [Sphaerochaetaceae bacterium]|nr:class I SAM-dependent methyltransferase [Sphaerochaetaceae bacterium]
MKHISYYNRNSNGYIEQTKDADLSFLYKRFLPLLPPGGTIIDGGCGSGRDLRFFRLRGYKAEGFDSSEKMATAASCYSGAKVRNMRFEDLDETDEYDGFWACASLIHVPRDLHKKVFTSIYRSLRNGGILYCSFKDSEEDFYDGERVFYCYTVQQLGEFVRNNTDFSIIDIWKSQDTSRKDLLWTNALLRKVTFS